MRMQNLLRGAARWTGTLLAFAILAIALTTIPPIGKTLDIRYTAQNRCIIELHAGNGVIAGAMQSSPTMGVGQIVQDRWSIGRIQPQSHHPSSFGLAWPSVQQSSIYHVPRLTEFFAKQPVSLGPRKPGDKPIVITNLVVLPLWIPFLMLAIPTAYLWYRDRRRPTEGHCPNCNYNLTGNQSGK